MELTRDQQKNPPVGSGVAAFVPFAADLQGAWMVLAMSDGVWKYARWDRIKEAGKRCRGEELIAAVRGFASLPRTGGLQDDFTLVVLEE